MGVTVTPEAPRASAIVDELYRQHGAEVYRYAYGVLGNRPDAEDMTQATFVNAMRALERGEQPRKPGNWLIKIAHNVARERFRRSQTRPTEVALDVDLIGAGPNGAEDNVSLAELTQALWRIPAAQRSALVLREFEGRPYAEIARLLGITTTALETLLFRARRSLAEELENVVTCERAARDIARLQEGAIGRKDRRRLDDHLRECAACARLRPRETKPARSVRGLLSLPLWFPLNLFRGGHKVIATASLHSSEAAAGAGGGGLVVGAGLAAKVAAVVVTTTVAGGVGYAGVHEIQAYSTQQPHVSQSGRKAHSATQTAKTGTRVAPAAKNSQATLHAKGHRTTATASRVTASFAQAVAHRASSAVGIAGKSASAPGRAVLKPNASRLPATTPAKQPRQVKRTADAAARATTPSGQGRAPGTARDASRQSKPDATATGPANNSKPEETHGKTNK